MPAARLDDIARSFALGEATLAALQSAARAERIDRRLADGVLRLIADWERSDWPESARVRNELRAHVKDLVPDAPVRERAKDPTAAMYEAGLRGQTR